MTPIPTERLRALAYSMRLNNRADVAEPLEELLAARDALAALTKERDEARKASAHWLKRCHDLGDEIDGLRAKHGRAPADVLAWANAVVADKLETEHLLNYENQSAAARWIISTRAALAATEGEQGGGKL
jgi:hypothetical protein